MKVLCIGHATYDIMINMEDYPIENSKNKVKNLLGCGGGQACNAAYLLGKWGIDTTFIGLVGNDSYGKYVKKELESVSVNTDYLVLKGKTTISYIIVNSKNGSRTPLTYHPTNLTIEDINEDINPDIILLDGYEYKIASSLLDKYQNAISILDAEKNTEEVINLGKKVDYVICSKSFLEKITDMKINKGNVFMALDKVKNNYKNIIVTLEELGCCYNNKIIPSIKVKAVDSTGAGDIFHGAFVYGLTKKWDIEKILRFSNIAGAMSVTRLGSRNSVFDLKQVEEVYNETR